MLTSTAGRSSVLRAHVQTWRPYTLWYIGLVGLAGAGLAGDRPSWWRLCAAWASPTIGWIGGHYLSDWFDRRLDAISKPHRPIPSGLLSAATALACGIACLVTVGTLSAAASWPTVVVAVLAATAIVAYGRRLKAHGLAGNLVRGALGALTLLYGAAVVAAPVHWSLLPFVLAFWAHDTSSNLVGTLRDIAGDRAGGYRTVPVRHGTPVAVHATVGLYAVALCAAVLGGYATDAASRRTGYLIALVPAAGLAGLAFRSLLRHRDRMPMAVALRAHELLVLERVWLAATVVGLGFGMLPAALLAVPALALTWWTQRHLRAGYEFGPSRTAPDAAGFPAPLPRRPGDPG